VIEREDKLAAIRPYALQRMGQTCRKIQKIALLHIGHLRTTILVENCHTAVAVRHDRPFGLLMTMQFANPPRSKPHVYARDRGRDFEIVRSDLPRPAAVLDALRRKVER